MRIDGYVDTDCEVCFFDNTILILADNLDEDEDFFDTLRIFKDRIPDDKKILLFDRNISLSVRGFLNGAFVFSKRYTII